MSDDDNADTADTGTDQNDKPDAAARTFTQEDLDRVVKERLNRQRSQFSDYDELKAKAEKLAEIEAANLTELEKTQTRVAELEKAASDATQRAKDALLRSAVVAEAARKNVVDPDAAVALLDRTTLQFDDDGSPTNIAEAMDSLLKTKPYLVGGGSSGSADLGARTNENGAEQFTREQLKNMTSAEIVEAQAKGQLDAVLKGEA